METDFKFKCFCCSFNTNRLNDWNKHISTDKHNKHAVSTTTVEGEENYLRCECGKLFKHRQSMSRHKKLCKYEDPSVKEKSVAVVEEDTSPQKMTAELLVQLIQQNEELKTMIVEERRQFMAQHHQLIEQQYHLAEQQGNLAKQQTQLIEYCKQPKTIKNNFNLNFFLNVQCKDALNISEFVNNLAIQIADVEAVGRLGYVDGISKIILTALQELDMYKRPIHCTDLKREVLFVKDEDKWDKDQDKKKLKRAINKVAHKNCQKLCSYIKPDMIMSDHPECEKNLRMMKNINGGDNATQQQNQEKIIKIISKNVMVDKMIGEIGDGGEV